MNNNKIIFSVEDAKVIDEREDSQFATLQIDAFASGPNRHDMFVSDETLKKCAHTILSKPVTWVYDKRFDDIGTHDPMQIPAGFVPKDSEITFKELPSGRTMMSVTALIWKKYSGKFLDLFRRDGGEKGVSVEMDLFDSKDLGNGLLELLDYCFSAITCLGDLVTPAIPSAKATLIQFSKEYEQAYNQEFSSRYDDVDFTVPAKVKENAERGLALYKEFDKGANAIALATARHLVKNEKVSIEKIKHIHKVHNGNKFANMVKDPPSDNFIVWMLYGGEDAVSWSKDLFEKIDELEKKQLRYFETVTFPYEKVSEMNPALRGIEPPITVSQGNEITRQAESIGSDKDKNGWAIAIANFKRSHTVKDGKWVKKEKMDMEDEKKEEMAVETPEEEKKENPQETPEEEKKEEEVAKKEEMSLDANLDIAAMLTLLEDETEDYKGVVEEEFAKPEGERNFSKVMGVMYAKMCKMAKSYEEMRGKFAAEEEKSKVYMAENEELKKFKADVESQRFEYEVEATMSDVSNSVEMPKDEMMALREEAKNFSLQNIDAWKNLVKAKAFGFAVKGKKEDGVKRYGLHWNSGGDTKKKSLWE